MSDEREEIVNRLHLAMAARRASELAYGHALVRAKLFGLNNSEISRACGVSEAAIRLWFKRHPNLESIPRHDR